MTIVSERDPVAELLADLGPEVDRWIADGACTLMDRHRDEWSPHEIREGLSDLYRLSGGDCAYDRPSIGASYALWYHGQRVQQILRHVLTYLRSPSPPSRIIDVGCGTGATAWAVALGAAATRAAGEDPPTGVEVHGVDASPFMTEAARCLWDALRRGLAGASLGAIDVKAQFDRRSWTEGGFDGDGALVVASYLFDHSDGGYVDELAEQFIRLADAHEASGALLTTAKMKEATLERVASSLCESGWAPREVEVVPVLWKGSLSTCEQARSTWYAANGSTESAAPDWVGGRMAVRHLARLGSSTGRLFAVGHLLPDSDQEAAATPDGRMTVIVGAAGSGKSRVLAERIVRTLEQTKSGEEPRILVTAFNKAVIDLLMRWIGEGIEHSGSLSAIDCAPFGDQRGAPSGRWRMRLRTTAGAATVTLMNRDLLPGQVFGVSHGYSGRSWSQVTAELIDAAKGSVGAKRADANADLLDPSFLEDELERVIYGMEALTLDRYLEVDRKGRGIPLQKEQREIVFSILMPDPLPDHFIYRRIGAYQRFEQQVVSGQRLDLERPRTHVFVDECQDFTAADYRLLACVPPGPERLVVAGDETQSMHLGPSYHRPGIPGRTWKKHELSGSYRLPLRVAEALTPLASAFVDTHDYSDANEIDLVLLEPRKSAVPGPRPIVLEGDSPGLAHELRRIFDLYRPLMLGDDEVPLVTVAEGEPLTSAVIRDCGAGIELDCAHGMRAIKGLEKRCVVFADCIQLREDVLSPEWIYTALTRSNALLVLVLWSDAPASTKAVLGRLDPDRLLFWNEGAERAFRERAALVGGPDDPLAPT